MTVAHQYGTLKNEKLQYRTVKQSVHNLINNLTTQSSSM